MKLLTICDSHERYGSENHMLRVARGLVEYGVEVHAAFPRAPGTLSMIADCEKTGVTYWPFDLHSRFGLLPRRFSVSSNMQVLRLLKSVRPDVVQITAGWPSRVWPGALSCAISGVPLLVVFQMAHEDVFLSRLRLNLLSWARRRRQRWMAVSQQNLILLRKVFGTRPDEIGILYNGVDVDSDIDELTKADTEALRRGVRIELSVPLDSRLVLTTARLSGQKGYGDLLQVIPKIIEEFPDVVFVWAGDGEQRQLLETQVKQSNLQPHVRFLGYCTDISRLLRASDLFVFPSHYEGGCSSAIREAMAYRLPIVCSDAGGIPEVLCNGIHALLFKSRDIHGILAQLRTALSAPAEMHLLAGRARQRIMDFSSERMVDDYFSVLSELKSLPA
jgi:glycosyltransferase involved in cell wall biosynthesis